MTGVGLETLGLFLLVKESEVSSGERWVDLGGFRVALALRFSPAFRTSIPHLPLLPTALFLAAQYIMQDLSSLARIKPAPLCNGRAES